MAVKRYDGSAWQTVAGLGAQGAAATSSTISTWVKTASGGETSLSGNDDNSQALSYTIGQELVFINGTLLKRGSDYTATNGTSITGLTALAANDVATVWTVNAFSVTGAIANTIVDAKGDLLVGTAADTPGRLAVGTNGQVLTAASTTGTGLQWATPASGGMTLISSQSMSGVSSVTFNSIAGTYNHLQLILRGYYASSGTPSLQWELNSDTTTTNYFGVADVYRTGTSSNQELWNTKNLVGSGMTYRTTSTSYNHLVIDLFDYTNTDAWKNCFIQGFQLTDFSTTNRAYIYGNLAWTDISAVTSIKILNSSNNNWSGGTALLYGVK
jgi:hypothetical protein